MKSFDMLFSVVQLAGFFGDGVAWLGCFGELGVKSSSASVARIFLPALVLRKRGDRGGADGKYVQAPVFISLGGLRIRHTEEPNCKGGVGSLGQGNRQQRRRILN